MTRLFLAAGVAALAISAPSVAKPGEGKGKGGQAAAVKQGGGGGQKADRGGGQQRVERQQMRAQRQQAPQRLERKQMRADRQQARAQRVDRSAQRSERQRARVEQTQSRRADRQQFRAERQQQSRSQKAFRAERLERADNKQQLRMERIQQRQVNNRLIDRDVRVAQSGQGYGVGGCPPGLVDKGCMPPGRAKNMGLTPVVTTANADWLRRGNEEAFRTSALRAFAPSLIAPSLAAGYLGMPLASIDDQIRLMALPQSMNYLYPENDDYYYRYGNGYLYQVDRGSNLIEALIPLLAGGLLPGTTLPSSYMNSYVPNHYGLNSFYPANYSNYGGYDNYYGNTCNRYAEGVIYQVDCGTGLIQNVVPTYAAGYGVGQMLPQGYNYYNVPTQYRSIYYPSNDQSYWYAPGAIYQVDPTTSLITSVAALLAPGLTVGQALPTGYGMYNVPLAYRDTYYDTPDAWYRYNNGNIYQVDPTTQLVTAIVASLLT